MANFTIFLNDILIDIKTPYEIEEIYKYKKELEVIVNNYIYKCYNKETLDAIKRDILCFLDSKFSSKEEQKIYY